MTVEDHAILTERGRSFSIELSNGLSFSGVLQGGNIQIHEPCK